MEDQRSELAQDEELVQEADLSESQPEQPKSEEEKDREERDKQIASQEQFDKRFKALWNAKLAGQQLGYSNIELIFEQFIHYKYDHAAEQKMKDIEEKDSQNRQQYFKDKYLDFRQIEFQKIDGLFREALAEQLVEGRSEKMEEYKELRLKIKEQYPKSDEK